MSAQWVSVTREDRVAIVRFDDGGKTNALSADMIEQLTAAARSFEGDAQTSVIVLYGRPSLFSLGFDVGEADRLAALRLAERRVALAAGPRLCAAWENLEPFTIAAVEGWCVGGAVALCAACDLRVAGAEAQFYLPEIERGMNMSWGAVPRLVNLVGPARAKRMIVLAERIAAARALDWGLVDEQTPPGGALDAALAIARRVAALPPVQVRMCKSAINAYANALAPSSAALDRDQFLLAQASQDHAEGIASFAQRRPPHFTGD
jgi:enoyl-CoA hydratase/carnithine racemase